MQTSEDPLSACRARLHGGKAGAVRGACSGPGRTPWQPRLRQCRGVDEREREEPQKGGGVGEEPRPVAEMGSRGGKRGQRVEDEFQPVAVESDTPIISPGRDARSGQNNRRPLASAIPSSLNSLSLSAHSLRGSASSTCPSRRPTPGLSLGPLPSSPGGLAPCKWASAAERRLPGVSPGLQTD